MLPASIGIVTGQGAALRYCASCAIGSRIAAVIRPVEFKVKAREPRLPPVSANWRDGAVEVISLDAAAAPEDLWGVQWLLWRAIAVRFRWFQRWVTSRFYYRRFRRRSARRRLPPRRNGRAAQDGSGAIRSRSLAIS